MGDQGVKTNDDTIASSFQQTKTKEGIMIAPLSQASMDNVPVWHSQPLYLTVSEIENPFKVLQCFFDCYHLPEARASLKEWLDTSLRVEDVNASGLVYLHDQLNKLVEAASLIYQRRHILGPFTGERNVDAVVALIVAAIAPERIFLLSESPIDLLIVMPGNPQKPFKEYERLIEVAGMNQETFYFSLHSSAELHRQLQQGHILYSIRCTSETIIYDNGFAPQMPPWTSGVEELKREAEKRFRSGLNKVRAFLESAKFHHSRGEMEVAAFMLHQAVELPLRALILSLTGQEVRTHEIRLLLRQYTRVGSGLKDIVVSEIDDLDSIFQFLERSYKDARYAEQFEALEQGIRVSIDSVKLLLEKVEQEFIRMKNIFV
jgi:HEPN domain-containing protein